MLFKRKEFLQAGALATASLLVPKFLKAVEKNRLLPAGDKVVVVLQFSGGNDGLNTIIPFRNEIYYKSRPGLGIKRSEALSLSDEAGIHPDLPFLKTLFDEGNISIMNNVGYPNPDRSHFRSMDIWQSASDSNEYLQTGWIGRYLDSQCNGCEKPVQALEIDEALSMALKGDLHKGIAFTDARKLFRNSNQRFFQKISAAHEGEHEEAAAAYLYKTLSDTLSSAEYIYEHSRQYSSHILYPSTKLGRHLKTVASLILSNINTRVYYVSLGSFDTHINQQNQQARLFKEFNDAVAAFVKDLKANHRFKDVVLMTFSEFGRRVSQNASGGTDHGTANNMFFISGELKQKGFLNELPNLNQLIDGDLPYTVDFKSVYATILNKWLKADDRQILGKSHEILNFL